MESYTKKVEGIMVHSGQYGHGFSVATVGDEGLDYVSVQDDAKLTVGGKKCENVRELVAWLLTVWEVTADYVQDPGRYYHTVSVDFRETKKKGE